MRQSVHRKRLHKWEAMCGAGSFVAGILTPLLGLFLLTIEWLLGRAIHPWLHITGTTLFVVGIPLILFAGFCLDWAEAGQKSDARKRARTEGVVQA